jgi:pyrroloquinoline quinone biosynthesis protein D
MNDGAAGHTVTVIDLVSRPALRPHVKFRHDPVRGRWVILAPERILTPNTQAAEALHRCDGERTVAQIAIEMAEAYDAEPATIAADIIPVLQGLADIGVLRS